MISEPKRKPEPNHQPSQSEQQASEHRSEEIGGKEGPDPSRFGDWEKNGRCIDF